MFKLGVKKFSESTQLIDASLVHGSVADVIESFKVETGAKDAELRIKSAVNLANTGAQLVFIIREINSSKKPANLLTSGEINLGKSMSDAVRSGEVHISALKDFLIVDHTNNTNGATYPLIVRPQEVADDSQLDKFAVNSAQAVTKTYERDIVNIDDVMNNLNL
jgi:hypothetical protein